MKKKIIITVTIIISTVSLYFLWWQLPATINRRSDIKLGNGIIKKIEPYSLTNGLPENDNWKVLKQFGFKDKTDFLSPEYSKIDSNTFELIFIEGFDGPYLLWNSTERKWKNGFPTTKKIE